MHLKEIFYSFTKTTLQVLIFYYLLFLSLCPHTNFQAMSRQVELIPALNEYKYQE